MRRDVVLAKPRPQHGLSQRLVQSLLPPVTDQEHVAKALKEHHAEQAKHKLTAGKAWQDNDLVFCTGVGTTLDAANVRRSFRRITKAAGIGENWTPPRATPLVRLDHE